MYVFMWKHDIDQQILSKIYFHITVFLYWAFSTSNFNVILTNGNPNELKELTVFDNMGYEEFSIKVKQMEFMSDLMDLRDAYGNELVSPVTNMKFSDWYKEATSWPLYYF